VNVKRSAVAVAAVFFCGLVCGWLIKSADGPSAPAPHPPAEPIIVNYPDAGAPEGRRQVVLKSIQLKTNQSKDVQALPSEPGATWVITFGEFGEPGWSTVVAVMTDRPVTR
jgi:hypothetical protein